MSPVSEENSNESGKSDRRCFFWEGGYRAPRATQRGVFPVNMDAGRSRRPHVLVAGYDEDTRVLLSRTLYKAGYDVTEFSSSVDAMQLLHCDSGCEDGRGFDLVVTDLPAPTAEAFDFLDIVGHAQACRPVILLTEPDQKGIRERAQQVGVTTVLRTPLDTDKFLEEVRRVAPIKQFIE